MDDSARLVIELLDRTGANAATPPPSSAGNAPIPGSTSSHETTQYLLQQGIGSKAGEGSVGSVSSVPSPSTPISAPPSPSVAPISVGEALATNRESNPDVVEPFDFSSGTVRVAPSEGGTATPSVTLPSQPSGDPLLDIVKSLLQADKNVQATEIQQALGIKLPHAEDLLKAAGITTQPQPAPSPTPTSIPPSPPTPTPPTSSIPPIGGPASSIPSPDVGGPLNYLLTTTSAQRQAEQEFGDNDTSRAREAQTLLQNSARVAREAAGRREEANVQPPPPPDTSEFDTASLVGSAITRNLGTLASSYLGGPMGSAVGLAANQAAPAIGNLLAGTSIGPTLAAAAPMVGVATAAIAIPAAVTYAAVSTVNNQENLAYQRIRDIDPRVAIADAQNELRQLQANFRTSARLGDEVAAYETAQSQFDVQSQGAWDRLTEGPMDIVTLYTKGIALANKRFNDTFDRLDQMIGGSGTFNTIVRKLNEWLDKQLGGTPSVGTVDWMEEHPHLAPTSGPFANLAGEGDVDRSKNSISLDIPGL